MRGWRGEGGCERVEGEGGCERVVGKEGARAWRV